MKKFFLFTIALISIQMVSAQIDLPPSGGNPKASITEEVGITNITITYSRPDVNKREGKIWGDGNVVTYGFSTANYITNKNSSPWRAGANENTTITFEHDVNLDEALTWSIHAMGGQKTYITLRNLATAYEKLNRIPEADSSMNEALIIATANQYTAYGRILISQKRTDKAMEVLLANQKRYADVFGVNNGIMFGYWAKGDYKNAVKYAEKSMTQAPSDAAKKTLEGQIAKLKEGKDIN